MATPNIQPSQAALRLAERLRDLREREFTRLTQGDLGRALGGSDPLSTATISTWETAASGRVPPQFRLEAYALLFCSPRAFQGGVHMLARGELTADETDRFEELRSELLSLREAALRVHGVPDAERPRSMWHFPDGSPISLVSYRVPEEFRPPQTDRRHLQFVRAAEFADLDTLIDVYGAIRAENPSSRVILTAAEDLDRRNVANHLVLVGGRTWKSVTRWFSRIFPLPIDAEDPGERGAIVVNQPTGGQREFSYTLDGDELIEDVGVFARGANPSAPKRTLTICTGITTRGVRGAAQCFIDRDMRERNENYLHPRFPEDSIYCIVMRVPVFNGEPLTPDLSIAANRLFEWSNAEADAESA